jgi:hypothetical protein
MMIVFFTVLTQVPAFLIWHSGRGLDGGGEDGVRSGGAEAKDGEDDVGKGGAAIMVCTADTA